MAFERDERFERWLDRIRVPTGGLRDAVVDVLDTAEGVSLWMAARTDLSELLRGARALGWTVRVLNRETVAVMHPDAGELLVSCATKRWLGRRRLAEALEKQTEVAERAANAGIPF